jgi:hypothetical protein
MWSEGRQEGGYVKDIGKEARPAAVAGQPKQAGEAPIQERWKWVEPSVWTERMLTDHRLWPNAYFAGLGLFTLTAAHELVCQSRRGKH